MGRPDAAGLRGADGDGADNSADRAAGSTADRAAGSTADDGTHHDEAHGDRADDDGADETVALPDRGDSTSASTVLEGRDGHRTAAGPDFESERAVLLDLLIYAWDRARSVGVWERLAAGLEQIGVEVIRPDGDVFDPAAHEVGGVEKTSDPVLHNTIAETESAGFRDRGRLIREPVVVVYRS